MLMNMSSRRILQFRLALHLVPSFCAHDIFKTWIVRPIEMTIIKWPSWVAKFVWSSHCDWVHHISNPCSFQITKYEETILINALWETVRTVSISFTGTSSAWSCYLWVFVFTIRLANWNLILSCSSVAQNWTVNNHANSSWSEFFL